MIDERADSDWANLKAVAPFTGAWIEMKNVIKYRPFLIVAPFTGAWIEILIPVTKAVKDRGRTLHGCVD